MSTIPLRGCWCCWCWCCSCCRIPMSECHNLTKSSGLTFHNRKSPRTENLHNSTNSRKNQPIVDSVDVSTNSILKHYKYFCQFYGEGGFFSVKSKNLRNYLWWGLWFQRFENSLSAVLRRSFFFLVFRFLFFFFFFNLPPDFFCLFSPKFPENFDSTSSSP